MERQPIHSGVQVLKYVTDKQPLFAGVDPYNIYLDWDSALTSRRWRRHDVNARVATYAESSFDVISYLNWSAFRLSTRPRSVSACGYIRKGMGPDRAPGSVTSCAKL